MVKQIDLWRNGEPWVSLILSWATSHSYIPVRILGCGSENNQTGKNLDELGYKLIGSIIYDCVHIWREQIKHLIDYLKENAVSDQLHCGSSVATAWVEQRSPRPLGQTWLIGTGLLLLPSTSPPTSHHPLTVTHLEEAVPHLGSSRQWPDNLGVRGEQQPFGCRALRGHMAAGKGEAHTQRLKCVLGGAGMGHTTPCPYQWSSDSPCSCWDGKTMESKAQGTGGRIDNHYCFVGGGVLFFFFND